MPKYYLDFNEQFRSEAARHKPNKDAFRERVHGYAIELVRSVCARDDLCAMTRTIIGGFHICIFFDITSANERTKKWVLRVPIPGEHGGDLLDEKFRSEVATMKYLSANVAIPIPRLVAYGLSNGPHPGGDHFMIMEHAEGDILARDLSQLSQWSEERIETLYSSLSDILLELWNHPFQRIGSIALQEDGEPDIVNLTRPLMLEFNNVELDGVSISSAIPPHRTFGKATEYFSSLADLQMSMLVHQRNNIESKEEWDFKFTNRVDFKRAMRNFVDNRWDNGPFVLFLGDLSPQNILVNESGSVTAILDLEWTSIRPIQAIGPPVWLSGIVCGDVIVRDADRLRRFKSRYEQFVKIFERQEDRRFQEHRSAFPDMRLSDIMKTGLSSGRYWFSEAAGSFYGFDGLFHFALSSHILHANDSSHSMMGIVASWIERMKLSGLRTPEPFHGS